VNFPKILVLVGVVVLATLPARADLVPVGDPVETGSWSQQFYEDVPSAYPFDLVAVNMTSAGDYFLSPAQSAFTQSNWKTVYEYPGSNVTLASAAGPNAVNWLYWNINFAGAKTDPLAFDFVAFRSGSETIVDAAHAVWSGSGWSFSATTWKPARSEVNPVPVPAALVLGAIGLGLAGWLKRRVA
jgi:hypothetical protein